jgi:hypothetical protein
MSFFKRHKVWGSVIGIIVVLVVVVLLLLLIKFIGVSTMDAPTERHYPDYMTGVVEPAIAFFIGSDDIAQMKEDSMNTLKVYFNITLSGPGYGIEKMFMTGLVKEAKKQGMSVHVGGQAGGMVSEENITENKIDNCTKKALELAKLCEEWGVEYFTPMTEADGYMGRNRAIEWHTEILPQIRKVFSGKVIAQWSSYTNYDGETQKELEKKGEGWDMIDARCYRVKASGDFDGVMLDYGSPTPLQMKYWFYPSKPLEEGDPYRPDSLEPMIIATAEAADKLGIPIYVGEFYVETTDAPMGLTAEKVIFTEEEYAEYTEKFIDTVAPYYDGIIHCFWTFPSGGIKDKPVEQVIKKKFGDLIK